jgi:molybdopterin-guanine dinucleotide biosynthesis protein A
MTNRYAEMDCFVLAGGPQNPSRDFEPDGELTRLEKGYRKYAAVFEKVKLVLKREQATERYLNYPHVCDLKDESSAVIGVVTALGQAESDEVFIGSSEITDFPLDLIVDLVDQYDGELFLGYAADSATSRPQPLFGIFSTRLLAHLDQSDLQASEFLELLDREGRLMPLPPEVSAAQIGLE